MVVVVDKLLSTTVDLSWSEGELKNCNLARNIKDSIFIKVNNPTLNRNIGKFNLPNTWDRVLLNTPGLNLKRPAQTVGHANSNIPYEINPTSPRISIANFPSHLLIGSEHGHRTS